MKVITEEMKYSARGFLMGLELGFSRYEQMRKYLVNIGDSFDCWPDWAKEANGHITKDAKAELIYIMMDSVK